MRYIHILLMLVGLFLSNISYAQYNSGVNVDPMCYSDCLTSGVMKSQAKGDEGQLNYLCSKKCNTYSKYGDDTYSDQEKQENKKDYIKEYGLDYGQGHNVGTYNLYGKSLGDKPLSEKKPYEMTLEEYVTENPHSESYYDSIKAHRECYKNCLRGYNYEECDRKCNAPKQDCIMKCVNIEEKPQHICHERCGSDKFYEENKKKYDYRKGMPIE